MESKEVPKRICLHCPPHQQKGIATKNFSRHLQQHHNARFQELVVEGNHRASKIEYLKDYTWENPSQTVSAPSKLTGSSSAPPKNLLLDASSELNAQDDQSRTLSDEPRMPKSNEEEKQPSRDTSSIQPQPLRKRDKKLQDKNLKSFERSEVRISSGAKLSISGITSISNALEARISLVEDDNSVLRKDVKELLVLVKDLQTELSCLKKDVTLLKQSHSAAKPEQDEEVLQGARNPISPIQEQPREVPSEVGSSAHQVPMAAESVSKEAIPQTTSKNIEYVNLEESDYESLFNEKKPSVRVREAWQTWLGVKANEARIEKSAGKNYKCQGQSRELVCKDGIDISQVVNKMLALIEAQVYGDEYVLEVSKHIVNSKLKLGYKILKVIGVGNLGTTVLAEDLTEKRKNRVLKIYHAKGEMERAVNEFKMLHLASKCPSILKAQSLIHSPKGDYLAIQMEDLTSYHTLYQFVDGKHEQSLCLKAARNCCAATAELHQLDIVHHDLASENIMIHPVTGQVKIIDFDLASLEQTVRNAGGNPDFVDLEIEAAMAEGRQITSLKKYDLFALGFCCYLLLGDTSGKFYESISSNSETLPYEERVALIQNDDAYIGSEVLKQLIKATITAGEAACKLDALSREK